MGVAWVGVPRVGEGVDSQNGSRRTTAAWASRSSYSGWEAGPVCQAGEAVTSGACQASSTRMASSTRRTVGRAGRGVLRSRCDTCALSNSSAVIEFPGVARGGAVPGCPRCCWCSAAVRRASRCRASSPAFRIGDGCPGADRFPAHSCPVTSAPPGAYVRTRAGTPAAARRRLGAAPAAPAQPRGPGSDDGAAAAERKARCRDR